MHNTKNHRCRGPRIILSCWILLVTATILSRRRKWLKYPKCSRRRSNWQTSPLPLDRRSNQIMNSSPLITILFFSFLFQSSLAAIPSLGLSTAKTVRSSLTAADFFIPGNVPPIAPNADFSVLSADASNKKALSATDTQFRVSTILVASGRAATKHYHPRGAEIVHVTKGRMQAFIWDEGSNPRVIRNVLRRGESTVVPQGLVHLLKCVSKVECTFVGVINSGDPGTVPVL